MIESDIIILQLSNELMDLDFKDQWLLINVFRSMNQTSEAADERIQHL